ncbi:MAG: PDZ domain-containing protein, partial [Candidatus Omnitrophota bacterium]
MSPEPTVTVGVVSALHRKIPTMKGQRGFLDLIQTDAAINPGNSGGPLCDLNGNVIGINVAIFSTSGGYQGIGFAIPMHLVKEILGDLIKGKEITYGWLGVSIQEVTPDIAEYLNMPDKKGAMVAQVIPDSPAAKYGIQEGDVIVAVDGKAIDTMNDLLSEINIKKVGETARVDVIRDRVKKRIDVKIGKRPASIDLEDEQDFESSEEVAKWRGMHVVGISKEIARELGLADADGVAVIAVDLKSPAYESGLRKGDVIRELNRTKIKTLADFEKISKEAKGAALIRADKLGYITIKDQ